RKAERNHSPTRMMMKKMRYGMWTRILWNIGVSELRNTMMICRSLIGVPVVDSSEVPSYPIGNIENIHVRKFCSLNFCFKCVKKTSPLKCRELGLSFFNERDVIWSVLRQCRYSRLHYFASVRLHEVEIHRDANNDR